MLLASGLGYVYSQRLLSLDHRYTSLTWTDYRRGLPPIVVNVQGNPSGPNGYKVSRGKEVANGYFISGEYRNWVAEIEKVLPTIGAKKAVPPLAAKLAVAYGDRHWEVEIGQEPSEAEVRLLSVGDGLLRDASSKLSSRRGP